MRYALWHVHLVLGQPGLGCGTRRGGFDGLWRWWNIGRIVLWMLLHWRLWLELRVLRCKRRRGRGAGGRIGQGRHGCGGGGRNIHAEFCFFFRSSVDNNSQPRDFLLSQPQNSNNPGAFAIYISIGVLCRCAVVVVVLLLERRRKRSLLSLPVLVPPGCFIQRS